MARFLNADQIHVSPCSTISPARFTIGTMSKRCLAQAAREKPNGVHFNIRLELSLKTRGEIEAAVCQGMSRFELEYMGRGPEGIRCHLIEDILIVRLQGGLTAAEQHLVAKLPAEKGRDLLKQVRSQLIEIARPTLEELVEGVTGIKPTSLHHDISTISGEEIVVFTMPKAPEYREAKKH